MLSQFSVLTASPYTPHQSPSHVIYLKKPTLVSTTTLIDSLTPPLTPIASKFGHNNNNSLLQTSLHSTTYRTEMTILPSFTNNTNNFSNQQ